MLAVNQEALAPLEQREIRRSDGGARAESGYVKSPPPERLADHPFEIATGHRGDRDRIETRLGDGRLGMQWTGNGWPPARITAIGAD